MPDLSVIIPARNEEFLGRTIENVLENARGDTEVIAILDGYWPNPPIPDHPRITLIHHTVPVGQRAAVNEGARLSNAKYIMKLDGHCAVDEGFDVKLMADCEYDMTVMPRLYNLHAFDWVCDKCGHRKYQAPTPEKCENCQEIGMRREIIWKPRYNRGSDFMRFDRQMVFQYWRHFGRRPEARADIAPLMGNLGACFFMHRRRFKQLGMLDERHGSWGQFGTEISCMAWLSGGSQWVNKKTWFSHMFRTQGGDFGFPYQISGNAQNRAREYSQELWLNDKWPHAKRKLRWLIEKFHPVPEWEDYLNG